MKKTVAPKAAKPTPTVEARESIKAQVIAFLQVGSKIQKIARGVSGQVYNPPWQITISRKR